MFAKFGVIMQSNEILLLNYTVELTKREEEILLLVAEGLSSVDIGKKIFVSTKAVEKHRYNIRKKLNITSRVGLICYAKDYKALNT